ncbi:hypothetical protein AVEN_50603-1 [Araneus ventricosus]|uniref:Uncharacterized protein n=1 Tax=Araneus ventricosus TaxID=182803 RepID=A0A4Y2AQ23_ARAVE|nr:hypothetical protein AVEN_50603-1 [Araneus ventricosus]
MTRTTPELAPPLQTSAPFQREDVWSPTYDLTCNRPNTRRIFSGGPIAETLPLGHSGRLQLYESQNIHNNIFTHQSDIPVFRYKIPIQLIKVSKITHE